MSTIYKYFLPNHGSTFFIPSREIFIIRMPKESKILAFQENESNLAIWVIVDNKKECEDRRFIIFATGQELPNQGEFGYIGTVQMYGNDLVWHLFEVLKDSE